MEKQEQVHDRALKCPRCDSSNTKFCYYNNYSLSQPRHFCKACKRYWTKGGILRNIPVGGGCRKNKKIKRPSPPPPSQIDISKASNHINPLFYGLPKNPPEINPTFSGLTSYDLHPQLNDEIQNIVTSSSLLSESYSLFGSSSSNTSPTMASLNAFQGFLPFKELQMESTKDPRMGMKEVRMEERTNLDRICNNMEWNVNFQNQMDQLPIGFSDQSLYWNVTNVGAWPDVTPLI